MLLEQTARALALHIPSIAVAFGIFLFALPDVIGSYEWGLTRILSLKMAGLLSIAISTIALIFRFYIRQERALIKKLIRDEFGKLNAAK